MCVIMLMIDHTIKNMKRNIGTDYRNIHFYDDNRKIINMLTQISPKLLDLSELYHQNNISLYENNKIRYLLFSIMHSKIPQLIIYLEPFKKTRPGLSRKPCTP